MKTFNVKYIKKNTVLDGYGEFVYFVSFGTLDHLQMKAISFINNFKSFDQFYDYNGIHSNSQITDSFNLIIIGSNIDKQ